MEHSPYDDWEAFHFRQGFRERKHFKTTIILTNNNTDIKSRDFIFRR